MTRWICTILTAFSLMLANQVARAKPTDVVQTEQGAYLDFTTAGPIHATGLRQQACALFHRHIDSELETTSRLSDARPQGDEKLVQLRERLGHPTLHPGDGTVESFLRGIKFVQNQQRLATFFPEDHRGDGTVVTFLISPDEARVRCHFDVPTEERHRL